MPITDPEKALRIINLIKEKASVVQTSDDPKDPNPRFSATIPIADVLPGQHIFGFGDTKEEAVVNLTLKWFEQLEHLK